MFNIVESIVRNNPCYKANKTIKVKGLMLHSIGCAQPNAPVLVKNYNNLTTMVCVHAFIDANNGTVYQTLPWNHRACHCGSGKNGSANNTHIGVEMCEPANIKYTTGANFTFEEENREAVLKSIKTAYDSAVSLFAKLCIEYNLDPTKDGVIISHNEGHVRGIASGHVDPEHLWTQTKSGYTMDGFRSDVLKAINVEVNSEVDVPVVQDENGAKPVADVSSKKIYRVRKSSNDFKSQLGAYTKLSNAKAIVDINPGYHVYDEDGKDVYPNMTVPFTFQVKSSETPIKIYKIPSKKSAIWDQKLVSGVYTIVKIQNGSDSGKGYGLLKAYSSKQNGWVNLDDVKHIL